MRLSPGQTLQVLACGLRMATTAFIITVSYNLVMRFENPYRHLLALQLDLHLQLLQL